MQADQVRGADGTCARRSAPIPARPTTSPDLGRALDQMLAVRQLALSSFGVTMSARSLARKMASGSFRAATMVMRFGRVPDPWLAPSLSGMPTRHSDRAKRRAGDCVTLAFARVRIQHPSHRRGMIFAGRSSPHWRRAISQRFYRPFWTRATWRRDSDWSAATALGRRLHRRIEHGGRADLPFSNLNATPRMACS
jgi:hypothetical protein